MTGGATGGATGGMVTEAATWEAWLTALTDAADDLERRLDHDEQPAFADVPPQPAGAGAPSPAVLTAARSMLDRLERLERRTEARRDRVGAQLRALAVPRPRSGADASYELGGQLDIAG